MAATAPGSVPHLEVCLNAGTTTRIRPRHTQHPRHAEVAPAAAAAIAAGRGPAAPGTHRLAAAAGAAIQCCCFLQRWRTCDECSNVLPAVCCVQHRALFARPCSAVGLAAAVEGAWGGGGCAQRCQADPKVLAHPAQQLVATNDDAIVRLRGSNQVGEASHSVKCLRTIARCTRHINQECTCMQ